MNSNTPAVCLVGKSWDFHVDIALGITNEENLENISESAKHFVKAKKEFMFDAEHFFDGYKANPKYALSCIKAAYDQGARWIVLCDTNGGTLPHEVSKIVSEVSKVVPGKNLGIVFLSGFNSDMQGKKALYLEKWAEENNHSFLRFDYSGHGQSSGTIDSTCFSDWYQDAEYLINKLTQDKQILIGSSMGAWIMLMLVKRIPQKISAIIGLAPAPDFPKLLIWNNMSGSEKRKLVKNRKTSIKYEDE